MAAILALALALLPNTTAAQGAGVGFRPDPNLLVSRAHIEAARERLADLPATLVVVDPEEYRVVARLGRRLASEAAPPCSTFKVPKTLIALEEGAVTLDDHALARDPAVIPNDDWRARGKWAEDQDLLSALRYSTVWYFQEVARRVGEEAMARWLERFDYGNRDLSGGIDTFWIGSSLRVSADGQADFLAKLVRGDLGVAAGHLALLKRGILHEQGESNDSTGAPLSWIWYGKTGSCPNPPPADVTPGKTYGDFPDDTPWVGWMVGWVERTDRRPLVYAYRVDAADYEELKALRDPLIRPLLSDLGLLPAR